MQTTVNIGVRLLNPENTRQRRTEMNLISPDQHTSNWQLRTTSNKSQKLSLFLGGEIAHDLQKITDRLAVEIVAVVCFD